MIKKDINTRAGSRYSHGVSLPCFMILGIFSEEVVDGFFTAARVLETSCVFILFSFLLVTKRATINLIKLRSFREGTFYDSMNFCEKNSGTSQTDVPELCIDLLL